MLSALSIKHALSRTVDETLVDFVDRAEAEAEDYMDDLGEQASPRFEMADYREVASALLWLNAHPDLPGRRFIEWGSGFAVVAGLAAQLGFTASGVENDPLLHGMAKHFRSMEHIEYSLFEDDFLTPANPDVATQNYDIIYAYPWPGEVETVKAAFEQTARKGAWLFLYLTFGEIALWEKG